jgi:GDPmannose 4,6-dehydratase
MKKKIALITGITGQDGSYLAEFLLKKNYIVHGIKRRSSSFNTTRIDHIYQEPNINNRNFILHYGDLSDGSSIRKLIYETMPDEIYNLGAQSHVKVSFDIPEYTSDINAIGVVRILECLKELKKKKNIKFYQASSSEIFGGVNKKFLNEKSNFEPRSPYAISKLFAYYMTKNYREAFNLFACNGILFNHESPRRGETFVTKKITNSLKKIINNEEDILFIGNLNAKRDWGHAKDYVEMMWKMLQQKNAEDYVISTGKDYSVRQFIELCSKELGFKMQWKNKGLKEIGIISKIYNKKIQKKIGSIIVRVDKRYFRPTEVNYLKGNSNKAIKKLNWKSKTPITSLIKDMLMN